MGNTANKPYRDEGSVAKRIHHIWIGSVIKPKERDYASIWAEVNNGSDMNENPSEPYQSRIWVDPNALMVGETKREIMRWAEWKALQDSQITDVKVFDQKMRDGGFRTRYTKRVLFWASQQRYALNEKLSAANPSSLDEIRVLCIGALRAERLDGDPESITQTLLDQLSIAILDMQEVLQDGNFQDINTVLNKPEHAALKAA